MPEFLEDPSVLTKEKLKSELIANNVTLPPGEQRKDVYVQLYLQHLTARNRPPLAAGANSKGPPDFSSDEERESTPVGAPASWRLRALVWGRKATKKTDRPRMEDKDDLDVTELTNEDLLEQLVKYGVTPGPIVGTTRKLYEKKLLKLREQGTESRSSTPLPTVSSSAENTRQNGSNDSDRYSDNEEGKKKEHKKVKSTREFVPFSELPTAPSGGFFQGISFPEISTRPPLGRTELQAAKRIHTSKGDPPREPVISTTLSGRGQLEKLASGGDFFLSSKSSRDGGLEKSCASSSQHQLTALLASAAASPSKMKETTTTHYKEVVEKICRGEKSGIRPLLHSERPCISDQSVISSEREVLEESVRSQVISPPMAQAIRDYVNSLLVQSGVGSLPGTSHSIPPLEVENTRKRIDQSHFQETESLSPRKRTKRSEKSVKKGDSGSSDTFQNMPGEEAVSSFAKTVVAHSLTTLGTEVSQGSQYDKTEAPELSIPLHESILKVIDEEWQQIDKPLPSLAYKYPISSTEGPQILTVPKVDDEILGFISEATPPTGIQAASTETCDKQLDLALCRTYEGAASALQIATHTAFVVKALQADISQAAQILSSDPTHSQQALGILSKTYDAASFLCEAAFDEVKMAAYTMGSSTVGRRRLWLKDCTLSPASKNKLTVTPFKGGSLFGGEVHKVIKRRGKKH
ncbi:thymopoietin isoform X1 [Echinops telfairi]|uniref:Thymopoietin isoform X1 n=1 Tax=Echinops telfairi TaxID=9371 RepID=A0ABM0IHX7_ECHTE|nr:thymopoietin isoform X1 [Echinops telfairi]